MVAGRCNNYWGLLPYWAVSHCTVGGVEEGDWSSKLKGVSRHQLCSTYLTLSARNAVCRDLKPVHMARNIATLIAL